MGRVGTNNTSFAYSAETSLGVAGPSFQLIEPNEIATFGATVTTVSRSPISDRRARRKGTVTNLESAVEFGADWTVDAFRDFVEGYFFARSTNGDVTGIRASGAETTGDTFTGVAFGAGGLTATQAAKLQQNALVWVRGSAAGNNGLKTINATPATNATSLDIVENLTDETLNLDIRISFAGYRIGAGESPTWTWDAGAKQATLAGVTGLGTTLQDSGLTRGQRVFIGSVASIATKTTVQNAFENSAANDMFGFALVRTINADSIVFDYVAPALQFTDSTAPATPVDISFGEFIRNVPVSDPAFIERSFTFESVWTGLANPSGDQYQYAQGNYCNTLALTMPLTDKATFTASFVGTDTANPTGVRATGAGAAVSATGVLTLAANATNNDTVTVGATTYTLQGTLTDTANNVLIGATASDTIDNLIAAINAAAGAGTLYGTGTVQNPVASAAAGAGDTMDVTARQTGTYGNGVATTETGADLSFGAATLTGGSDGNVTPTLTGALNSSADIATLRIADVDDTGLTTDFKSLTITLNNNVTPENVLGRLGAAFLNTGNFEVDIEAQLLFTNGLVIDRIRANTTVAMGFSVKNDDGAIYFDVPEMTLGGGQRELPVNETVLVNLTGVPFDSPTYGFTMGCSIFPTPLP